MLKEPIVTFKKIKYDFFIINVHKGLLILRVYVAQRDDIVNSR